MKLKIELTQPELNIVLAALERMPFGQVRAIFTEIEQQVIPQIKDLECKPPSTPPP